MRFDRNLETRVVCDPSTNGFGARLNVLPMRGRWQNVYVQALKLFRRKIFGK